MSDVHRHLAPFAEARPPGYWRAIAARISLSLSVMSTSRTLDNPSTAREIKLPLFGKNSSSVARPLAGPAFEDAGAAAVDEGADDGEDGALHRGGDEDLS